MDNGKSYFVKSAPIFGIEGMNQVLEVLSSEQVRQDPQRAVFLLGSRGTSKLVYLSPLIKIVFRSSLIHLSSKKEIEWIPKLPPIEDEYLIKGQILDDGIYHFSSLLLSYFSH